ncbi:MAG: hypothetical protein RL318_234 [Fibrobacterota bacterium]|jgi:predicted dehydrogenase
MKTMRWGILGCGHIAGKFARDLALVPDAALVASWGRNPENVCRFAAQYGGQGDVSRAAFLANPEIDVVYVASPHHLHLQDTLDCLEAGKAVLCEKPFGQDLKAATRVFEVARSKNLFVMEALWTRFLPHLKKALELVEQGILGDVRMVEADFGIEVPFNETSRLFMASSGGSLWDIGIYPIFLARLFLGNPTRVKAMADWAPTGVDQRLSMALAFEGGKYAQLYSGFCERTECTATLHGSLGKLRIEGQFHVPSNLVLTDKNGVATRLEFPREGFGYQHETVHVHECLRAGLIESPLWTHADTLGLLGLMERVARSTREE